jgi:hypothetical protein
VLVPSQGHAWPAPRFPPNAVIRASTTDDRGDARSRHHRGSAHRPNQTQAGMAGSVDRDHRMRHHAVCCLSSPAQTAAALCGSGNFTSVVSWIASTCRPATAAPVRSLHPWTIFVAITFGLPKNRPADLARAKQAACQLLVDAKRKRQRQRIFPAKAYPNAYGAPPWPSNLGSVRCGRTICGSCRRMGRICGGGASRSRGPSSS